MTLVYDLRTRRLIFTGTPEAADAVAQRHARKAPVLITETPCTTWVGRP